MAKAKTGTYLVEFTDGTSIITGNNYKPWWQHTVECIFGVYHVKDRVKAVEFVKSVKYSGVPFVDDGGLKWASPEAYHDAIRKEAARLHQTFTPFKDIKFETSYADKALLKKKLAHA